MVGNPELVQKTLELMAEYTALAAPYKLEIRRNVFMPNMFELWLKLNVGGLWYGNYVTLEENPKTGALKYSQITEGIEVLKMWCKETEAQLVARGEAW